MSERKKTASFGMIYVVATPIGNLDDFPQRAQSVLASVDFIACEDTRHSKRLLNHFAIQTPLISMHDFNENQRVSQILDRVAAGENCALISDAGTPLISDPGYHLVSHAHGLGIKVSPIPGPSALITALSAAGIATDRFVFEGFLAAKTNARSKQLETIKQDTRSIIFYLSPHHLLDALTDIKNVLGEDRVCVLARELTKLFETIKKASIAELIEWVASDPNQQKGEFVILIEGVTDTMTDETKAQARETLHILLEELPTKQAVMLAQKITKLRKNELYNWALAYPKK